MGHKEVGGVKAAIAGEGRFDDIMEQLEIDWKYAPALQAADNELLARIAVKEVFRRHGLEVTFLAKPMEGVAGSGEHTHVSVMACLKDGTYCNLFAPTDQSRDFLSPLGWGALMGLLRNYEAVGAFVTASNDAFSRLKPGFEAPVAVVASIGHDVSLPSRNRTVLVGLIRDRANPRSTRFEIRSPNPHTNSFLALSAIFQAMADGMEHAAASGKSSQQLEAAFCKAPGMEHPYLEKERAYRTESDVFEHYTEAQRQTLFGKPPATVWETLENLDKYPHKTAVLAQDGVFTQPILDSYKKATLTRWTAELYNRIIPANAEFVRACVRLHHADNELDEQRWIKIQTLRQRSARDEVKDKSVFTAIREAIDRQEYRRASELQLRMVRMMQELRQLYQEYRRNILPVG
jgi:glutamine synthetase